MKDKFKNLLANNEVEEVITDLLDLSRTEAIYSRHQENVILISNRYRELMDRQLKGIISYSTFDLRRNQLNSALYRIIQRLDERNYSIPIDSIEKIINAPEPENNIPNHVIDALKKKKDELKKEELTFLLMGRTGVGKSSTINSLFNKELAEVGKFVATTSAVREYRDVVFGGIKLNVVDTPGLRDDLEEKLKDEIYISEIRKKANRFDCLLFVSPLSDTRVTSDEKRAIKIISQALGSSIWEHAVIVFTFSNQVSKEEYGEYVTERTKLIRREIEKWIEEKHIAKTVPSVAIDNECETNPGGVYWINEFYTTVFSKITDRGLLPFLVALKDDISFEEPSPNYYKKSKKKKKKKKKRINLNDDQLSRIGSRLYNSPYNNRNLPANQRRNLPQPRNVEYGTIIQETAGFITDGFNTVSYYARSAFNYVKFW